MPGGLPARDSTHHHNHGVAHVPFRFARVVKTARAFSLSRSASSRQRRSCARGGSTTTACDPAPPAATCISTAQTRFASFLRAPRRKPCAPVRFSAAPARAGFESEMQVVSIRRRFVQNGTRVGHDLRRPVHDPFVLCTFRIGRVYIGAHGLMMVHDRCDAGEGVRWCVGEGVRECSEPPRPRPRIDGWPRTCNGIRNAARILSGGWSAAISTTYIAPCPKYIPQMHGRGSPSLALPPPE
jgi:hypothetical protein